MVTGTFLLTVVLYEAAHALGRAKMAMIGNQHFARLIILFMAVLSGCSNNNQVGTPGHTGYGGAATVTVAGLKIEAQPTGIDGGSVSTRNDGDGVHHVTISEVEVVVKRWNDGSLNLTIDGKYYGTADEGDHLLIDRSRDVFLNNQRITPGKPDAGNDSQQSSNEGE